jgi:SAM-dependent methyltransferase
MDFQTLSTAYTGAAATGYDARRAPTTKWLGEDSAVDELLRVVTAGSTVLDMPVGTGRFLKLYRKRGMTIVGRDISPDMLKAARAKLEEVDELEELHGNGEAGWTDCTLQLGDIRAIPDDDDTYDCALSSRFLNWVDARGLEEVLGELRRVSKRYLIVGIRHQVPTRDLLLNGPKGLRRFVTRYLLDFRRSLRRLLRHPKANAPHTIQHDRDVIFQTFRKLKLRIDTRILVENGRDGTDYYFYSVIKEA